MEESNDCTNMEEPNQSPQSSTLSSPFKNLPNVSVCLNEEDRIPVSRELKGVKRSLSTGSNSSNGSTDVQKSFLLMKRRKVEKPAPVVLGRQNDCYCWVCHRENISLTCIACPRAYHARCAGEINSPASINTPDWVCPECQHVLAAENVDTRSSTLAEISLDRLGALLKLSLSKMKLRAPIAFHQAVSLEFYPKYLHYVIHPMDFCLLEKNIKQKVYGCTEAFLADVKWISHNSCVFNGTQHPLSTNAKNLVKSCDLDMQEIEVCPDCFVHSVVRNKYWFSEVCRKPHPLVWAKLKGFPYWPAKVVRILDGNVDCRFFGAHDRAWVPMSQCYHLSKDMPTTSKPKKKGNYEAALDELNVHVHFLTEKFGIFEYAPCRTNFNPENKSLMYHGIDIDKISKEDLTIDSNPQQELNLVNFEKKSRFASFLESEHEKSNAEETKQNENQFEMQANHIFRKIGIKSPSFITKERISTDSSFSEKDVSTSDSKSTADSKSMDDLNSIDKNKSEDEPKSTSESADLSKLADKLKDCAEIKKNDSTLSASEKESAKISDSDQLRKLELALERIKGYVSLNSDTEKENDVEIHETESKNKNDENENSSSELKEKDNDEKSKVLSPLFKGSTTFPIIEPSESQEAVEDVAVALEATKKTDSFFLKLNETIASCKAKLGISEINDELSSDESAIDDNASRSDEDEEEEETSASEVEEVVSDAESVELSDEEVENKDDDDDDAESEEDESEGQDTESIDTDIESSNETSPTKIQNSNVQSTDNKTDAKEATYSGSVDNAKDLSNDNNEAIITNSDVKVQEVTIDVPDAVKVKENSVSESTNGEKRHSEFSLSEQANKAALSKIEISPKKNNDTLHEVQSISTEASKDKNSNIGCVEISNSHPSSNFNAHKADSPFKNIVNTSPMKKIILSNENTDKKIDDNASNAEEMQSDIVVNKGAASSSVDNNEEAEDDDDEILIYTPTKPKSPPVIVLDDDQENENSSASDTFAIKSPPYSTSVDSLSNDEKATCRPNSGEDPDNRPDKTGSVNDDISHEEIVETGEEKNVNDSFDSRKSENMRKRKLSSGSSDEDIQIVTPAKMPILTGAIRTFHKPNNNVPSLKPPTPTVESVKRNLEKESLSQLNMLPTSTENGSKEASSPESQFSRSQLSSPSAIERLLKCPVDTSNLSDKDKEIFYLKNKLNCVLTAYQIQSWKCSQEKDELRHNMNLIVMEMRACLESDKKQAIDALSKKFEQEKQKSIEDAKRKQWCAFCLMESRYACCWNTSYCSVDCQKKHFNEHRHSCSQLKSKSEVLELKQKSATAVSSESTEGKKVYILNMKQKPSDPSQQVSVNKTQIQVKQPLQVASSSGNIPGSIQFVIAPKKPTTESVAASSNTSLSNSTSKELDTAQIINQVRKRHADLGAAIAILKKKNMEANKTDLNKKEEQSEKEANLEDIYFPSPPKITFEGYDSATPDPNLVLENEDDMDPDPDDIELPHDVSLEPDVVFSDSDDKDNEMVNIGHTVEMKAKFLNKCLVYGQTARKLTRCLVDVIFPDVKLLATCSAFGQKSNVTKLTRAALPSRKVHAIIDYVQKRFPGASRSEIVLQINMKCKEARVIQNKRESELSKKAMGRRLLAREKEDELATTSSTTTTSPSITTSISSILTSAPTSSTVISPNSSITTNVFCVKSQPTKMISFNVSKKTQAAPNILRCNSQILIKPKPTLSSASQPMLKTVGNAAILQAPPQKKRETVRNLLAANKMNLAMENLSQNAKNLVMAIESSKPPTPTGPPPSARPYIIIGSQKFPAKPSSTSVQQSAPTVTSQVTM